MRNINELVRGIIKLVRAIIELESSPFVSNYILIELLRALIKLMRALLNYSAPYLHFIYHTLSVAIPSVRRFFFKFSTFQKLWQKLSGSKILTSSTVFFFSLYQVYAYRTVLLTKMAVPDPDRIKR